MPAPEWKDMTDVEKLADTITMCNDAQNGYADVDNREFYKRVNWLLTERDRLLEEYDSLRAAAVDDHNQQQEQLSNARAELASLKTRLAELEIQATPTSLPPRVNFPSQAKSSDVGFTPATDVGEGD